MNNAQLDKYTEVWDKYKEECGHSLTLDKVDVIYFALSILQEQANDDISFLGEMLAALNNGETEHLRTLIVDWQNELIKLTETE